MPVDFHGLMTSHTYRGASAKIADGPQKIVEHKFIPQLFIGDDEYQSRLVIFVFSKMLPSFCIFVFFWELHPFQQGCGVEHEVVFIIGNRLS